MSASEEAAQILTRVFEALARQSGKTLAAGTRADVLRACELLSTASAELDDLLEDLPEQREYVTTDANFERWRMQRSR